MIGRIRISAAIASCALAAFASPASAIVNGTQAGPSSWPWAVQVINIDETSGGICGGTLVGPKRVVTAGHCVSSSPSKVFVVANAKELDLAGNGWIAVSNIELAPSYVPGTATDVAVLTLAEAPTPATTIDVLGPAESGEFPLGASAQVAGWGSTSGSSDALQNLLQQGSVTLEGPCGAGRCSVTPTEPCAGDSGGPVVVQLGADTVSKDPSPENGTWRLAAIPVAGGEECSIAEYADLTEPTMRTFVGSFLDDPPPVTPAATPLPTAAPIPPPQTTLVKARIDAEHGKASFRFKGSNGTSGFQCALASRRGKASKFKPCRSPKLYKNLAAGTYTFKVGALSPGGVDPSPAKKRFTIR